MGSLNKNDVDVGTGLVGAPAYVSLPLSVVVRRRRVGHHSADPYAVTDAAMS